MKEIISKVNNLPAYFYLLLVNLLSLIIIIPFWMNNNLLAWDFVGHIQAINYTKEYLFPDFQGWNNVYSLGYPQGYFYPFFWHYLIAALCFVYDSPEFWIKLIFSISLISLPWIGYLFSFRLAKTLKLETFSSTKIASISSLIILFSIIFGPMVYGGTLRSFLVVGLITNFYTLIIFLLYMYFLLGKNDKFVFRKSLLLAFLLTIILFSHLVTALVAIVITLSLFVSYIINKARKVDNKPSKSGFKKLVSGIFISNYSLALLIAFISTAFFYIPLILNSNLVAPILGINVDRYITLIMVAIVLFGIFAIYRLRSKLKFPYLIGLFLPLAFFVMLAVLEILSQILSVNIYMDKIQPYRLLSFAIIFLPAISFLLLIKFLESFSVVKQKLISISSIGYLAIIIVFIAVIGAGFFINRINAQSFGEISFNEQNIESRSINGNFISFFEIEDNFYLYRTANYPSLQFDTNAGIINTQFNESSFINSYAASIKNSLYDKKESKELANFPETFEISTIEALDFLRIMNTDFILFTNTNKLISTDICKTGSEFEYAQIKTKEGKAIRIFGCIVNWDTNKGLSIKKSSLQNFQEVSKEQLKDQKNIIYLHDSNGQISESLNAQVIPYEKEILWSNRNQSFTVNIRSVDSPYTMHIIPVQYNPNWKAYTIDSSGQKSNVEIYRIAPNLIGVNKSGEVKFDFEPSNLELILKLIGICTFILNTLAISYFAIRAIKKG